MAKLAYSVAKQIRQGLEIEYKELAAKLDSYPKHDNGLALDSAKTDQWRADRAAANQAFQRLRRYNAEFVKAYRDEIRDERRQRRQELGARLSAGLVEPDARKRPHLDAGHLSARRSFREVHPGRPTGEERPRHLRQG